MLVLKLSDIQKYFISKFLQNAHFSLVCDLTLKQIF